MVPSIELVHLVWAPLGPVPFTRFLASYRSHDAGAAHRLLLVAKKFRDAGHREPWDELVSGLDHEWVEMPEPALDLAAYRRIAAAGSARLVCFTNSTTVALAEGWLAALAGVLEDSAVGMAGATGSWESTYTAAPPWLKPLRLRHFAPFPNPHLRTNSFVLERELMLDLDWPDVGMDKLAALRLENGRRSINRQIEQRGLETVVVGRDGRAYGPQEWPASRTFRSGDQGNLLVGDNRTAEYRDADASRRRELARFAWGPSASAARR